MKRAKKRRRVATAAPNHEFTVHQNLALVRTPDSSMLEQLLVPPHLRKKVVRKLDDRSILIPRSACAAIRKRLADLGLPEVTATSRSSHEPS